MVEASGCCPLGRKLPHHFGEVRDFCGSFGRVYGENKFRSTERSGLRFLSVAMSTSSGQELVPVVQDEAQLMPMDVNGADQSVTETAPRVEEPAEGSNAAGPSVSQSQSQEPEPVVVDQRIFVHAPQYHWHQEGGIDSDAHAAIEKLHKDTHDFAVATVKEVDALNERIDGVSERIDATAAAVEQQMEMVLAAGQGPSSFRRSPTGRWARHVADLVEGIGQSDSAGVLCPDNQRGAATG